MKRSNEMANITFNNIVKKYDENIIAIENFNLEIRDKEFIVLVGPSGCGKSTTLRMIAGLESITEGELFIGDKLVNNIAPKDRDIAMVFQNYALYPHMTVYKNIAFGLEMRKVPKHEIHKKIAEVAKTLHIEGLLQRKPKQLSGGQCQRVALGRAIVGNPSVFLLDEPLSNLDAKLRTQMRTEIIKLHKTLGTTFVYVTHDQTEAMTMADRIVLMKDGLIQQVDTPMNLYNNPCNLFVAEFMGSPKMNTLEVILINKSNNFYAKLNCITIKLPNTDKIRALFSKYSNKSIILGFRPEDIYIESNSIKDSLSNIILTKVDITELMGSESYLYLDCKGNKLIAKVPSSTCIKSEEEINIAIDTNKLHFFDKDTEERINV
jgi:multiple sugar transport system ATP-binding protein